MWVSSKSLTFRVDEIATAPAFSEYDNEFDSMDAATGASFRTLDRDSDLRRAG